MKTIKILFTLFICCLTLSTLNAQTVIKTNNGRNKKVKIIKNNNKKVIVKTNRHNSHSSNHVNSHNSHNSHHNGNGKVIVRSNRNNIIIKRPNRPRYYKKPILNRRGHVWISGFWSWSGHTYIWVDGFWERERHGFHWHEGNWEETPHGFFWVEGYWCDIY
ncbi:MAG: YXWGXW repeat-containing protein [Flavobacteriales bacterium]|nr:YXWGXW repeat-containing protein [Flavobacteriales bacterium]